MAQIRWTAEAQRWLQDIYEYIAAANPDAAARTVQAIYDRAQELITHPQLGYRYVASHATCESSTTSITASPNPAVAADDAAPR